MSPLTVFLYKRNVRLKYHVLYMATHLHRQIIRDEGVPEMFAKYTNGRPKNDTPFYNLLIDRNMESLVTKCIR